jgi:small subunit ribosomal protein S18
VIGGRSEEQIGRTLRGLSRIGTSPISAKRHQPLGWFRRGYVADEDTRSSDSRQGGEAPGGATATADGGSDRRRPKRYSQLSERKRCRFTKDGVKRIDYKDIVTLQKLMTGQGKMLSRKRTGVAARYQRMIKIAIKRARYMALMPYTG